MSDTTSGDLLADVQAVCPVVMVMADRDTPRDKWAVVLDDAATPEQVDAARKVVAGFQPIPASVPSIVNPGKIIIEIPVSVTLNGLGE